jgi:hypothetical protein
MIYPNTYFVNDEGDFQIDTDEGSWVYARSRFANNAGRLALTDYQPHTPEVRALAETALAVMCISRIGS